MVRLVCATLATVTLEEESRTSTGVIAFDGNPASSTSSTLTNPLVALGSRFEGELKTSSCAGKPLGVAVVMVAKPEVSPWDEAVITAEPGVVVVVALVMTYSLPTGSVTGAFVTETMFVSDDERYTVIAVSAADGSPFESTREITRAG